MKIFVFILVIPFVARCQSIPLGDQVCQNMWNNAKNNLLLSGELAFNPGHNPLFTLLQRGGSRSDEKLQSDVFTRFYDLLVDFQAPPLNFDQQHIDDFINAVTQPGGPMEAAFNYLKTQPNALPWGVTTLTQFRWVLEKMWFLQSDGFKHVFVGNKQNLYSFNGFHNWYQFYTEQARGQIEMAIHQAPNFVANRRPNFLRGLSFKWRGLVKQDPSSMFVGTSPAFDLALFTTCLLKGRGNRGGAYPNYYNAPTSCTCNIDVPGIGRSRVKVKTVENTYGEVVTAYPTGVY